MQVNVIAGNEALSPCSEASGCRRVVLSSDEAISRLKTTSKNEIASSQNFITVDDGGGGS